MNPRKATIKDLEEAGYEFDRHGANHDIYKNKKTGKKIPLKRHDFDEDDRRYIQKEIKHNKEDGSN